MSTEDVKAIQEWIAEALSGEFEGRIEDSVRLADQAYAAAQQAGERALQTRALVQKARALDCRQTAAERGASEDLYHQALDIAAQDGDAVQTAVIWRRLALLAIRMDPDTTRASTYYENHSITVAALPEGDPERARNHHLRSEIAYREANYVEAENYAGRAIESVTRASQQQQTQQVDPSPYQVALAKAIEAQGRIGDAIKVYERAQPSAGDPLRRSHVDMITLLMNHGLALKKRGDVADARKMLSDALNKIPGEVGQTLDAGIIHAFLSDLSYSEGQTDDAAFHAHEALKIYDAIGAPDHRKAEAWTNIANVAMKRGEFGAACDAYQHALDLRHDSLRAGHYQLGVNQGSLAEALVGLGRYSDAEPHASEAQRILAGPGYNREALQWIDGVHTRVLEGLKRGQASRSPLLATV